MPWSTWRSIAVSQRSFALLTCAVNRVGFYTAISFWRKGLSTHLLFCNISNGIYDNYDQLAALFGAELPDFRDCSATFRAALGLGAPQQPDPHRPRLGVAPCCSGLSSERTLRADEWVEVIRRNMPPGDPMAPVELHLFGAPSDRRRFGRTWSEAFGGASASRDRQPCRQKSAGIGDVARPTRSHLLYRFGAAALCAHAGQADGVVLRPYRSASVAAADGPGAGNRALFQVELLALRPCIGQTSVRRQQHLHAVCDQSPRGRRPEPGVGDHVDGSIAAPVRPLHRTDAGGGIAHSSAFCVTGPTPTVHRADGVRECHLAL